MPLGEDSFRAFSFLAPPLEEGFDVVAVGLEGTGIFDVFAAAAAALEEVDEWLEKLDSLRFAAGPRSREGDALEGPLPWLDESSNPREEEKPFLGGGG